MTRKYIEPGTRLAVKLSTRERDLVVEQLHDRDAVLDAAFRDTLEAFGMTDVRADRRTRA